jgi:GAF domain-containing protein
MNTGSLVSITMSRVSNDFKNDDMAKKLSAIRLIQELNLEMEAHWQLLEIFQLILRFLHEVFGFQYSMIYLLDFDSDTLSFQAGWGHPEGHHSDPIKLGQGYIGTSAKSGEILRIGNLRSAFLYSRAVRNRLESSIYKEQLSDPALLPEISPIKSQMSVPLKIKSNVIGVIVVESVKSNAFDELDQELLLIIAGQTAQFIDRVRRADQERMEKEELLDVMGHLHRLIEYLNTAFVEMNLPLDVARSRLGWAML